jgi:hypothetical protein
MEANYRIEMEKDGHHTDRVTTAKSHASYKFVFRRPTVLARPQRCGNCSSKTAGPRSPAQGCGWLKAALPLS